MAIKIPVSAQFDAADLKQQIQMVNDQIRILASQVGQANNQKFEPINVKSKEDLDAFIKQMQKLLKIQTELKTTMGKTGQGASNPLMADWKKMYGDQAERIKKMQSMLQFLGVDFDDNPKPKPPRPTPPVTPPALPPGSGGNGGGFNWRQGWGAQGLNIAQTGLRAAGPVGGVVSSALGTGLSAGAGAGLMGLVGGLAALGVGKIIGAIADKVAQAQDNAIGLDKLYRQVGGVASYALLKNSIGGAGGLADSLGMKTSDAISMASAYSRANLRPGDNPMTGLLTAGGMARTFGLDPTGVAGSMARLRGANIGRSDQDTRRMGALIGEAIGRSGAFGQANEAMEAITNYATTAARQSLTGPNVAGYGGALAGLMQTGMPGMDVQGAASLLSRVNSALTRGGNMGEASQAFTARMGMSAGLNPYQTRAFQETGMFGTLSSAFGKDSPYGRAFGAGPQGNTTMFDLIKRQMGRMYGQGTPEYYMALANHLGTGLGEAETLATTDTRQLVGADTRAKRLGLNASPQLMAQMGMIEGGGAGLQNMARDYLGRKDLNESERSRLMSAYNGSDTEKLKDVMSELVSAHGGTKTEGSQIRDNVAKLDNTMTRFTDRALPSLDMMRMALVKMAGVGDEASLRQNYIDREKSQGKRRIDMRFDNANRQLQAELNLVPGNDKESWKKRNAIMEKQAANNRQREIEINAMNGRVDQMAGGISSSAEVGALDISTLGDSPAAMIENAKAQLPQDLPGGMANRAAAMEKDIQDAAKKYNIRPSLLRGLIAQESRFKNNAVSRAGAVGPTQIMPKSYNAKYMKQYDIYTQRGNIMAGAAHLRDDIDSAGGNEYEGISRYNGGTGKGRLTEENRNYTPGVYAWEDKFKDLNNIDPKTMPQPGGRIDIKAAPLEVQHKDASGQTIKTEQLPLSSTFVQPRSFATR